MRWIRILLAATAGAIGALLAAPLLVLGAPFWIVGSLTRFLAPVFLRRVIRWPDLFEFDPAIGWRVKPNMACHCLEDRDDVFHVVTDDQGWPDGPSIGESDLVVIGDSHAFGYGVDHANAFFSQLTRHVRTKAIGVPGYNLVQEVLLMDKLAVTLRGKVVIWLIYIGNDLHESLSPEMNGYRTPFVRQINGTGTWEIVRAHLSAAQWRTSDSLRSRDLAIVLAALHHDTFLSTRAFSACAFLIERAARLSREAGFRLAVVTIPTPFALAAADGKHLNSPRDAKHVDADFPDRRINAICTDFGIPCFALRRHLRLSDYKPTDDHWTESGHRKVAAVLAGLYRDLIAVPPTMHASQ